MLDHMSLERINYKRVYQSNLSAFKNELPQSTKQLNEREEIDPLPITKSSLIELRREQSKNQWKIQEANHRIAQYWKRKVSF